MNEQSSTRTSTFIDVKNFSFDYDNNQENPLLKNINFSVEQNETILIIGPSGSGKSTLSLCLNGLYPEAVEGWADGSIYYNGQNIQQFKKGKLNQQIGVVFQEPESQFCMVTVENELAFTMENINIPREEMKEKMIKVLTEVGLEQEISRPIHELSGGQMQRVALAAVLLLEPEVLILDEPTSNLDPVARENFIRLVEKLQQTRDMSILIIEHQLDDWVPLVNRVIALNKNGELIDDGTPQEVFYENYDRLQQEGIVLPKVIHDAMNIHRHERVGVKHRPLTETELVHMISDVYEIENHIANIFHFNQDHPFSRDNEKYNKRLVTIKCSGISFARKKETILHDINLQFEAGEFVAIVGKNGAGKSTLLHVLAGLLQPATGKRLFLGKEYDGWDERELRKNIGFVFQNPEHQFITNTVYDELSFGMKVSGMSETAIKHRVDELLTRFGLMDKRFSNPFSLSGGQKRRLSVATMLHETPHVLLFDEPTFGQDEQTTAELMNMIMDLRRQGTTIVFVTHDMDLVDRYCERVLVLDKGKIIFNGSPQALWKKSVLIHRAHLRLPYRVRIVNKLTQMKKGDLSHVSNH